MTKWALAILNASAPSRDIAGWAAQNRRFMSDFLGGLKKTGEQGLEPRLMDPETIVLPLHHSPVQVD